MAMFKFPKYRRSTRTGYKVSCQELEDCRIVVRKVSHARRSGRRSGNWQMRMKQVCDVFLVPP